MKNRKSSISAETGPWRLWLWAACEGFVLFSLLRCMRLESVGDALVCLLVGAGATVPWVLERLGYRMSGPLFVFTLFYLLASMSGRIYKLYYLVAHWDKMLHLCGGVAFALVGCYIPVLLDKKYKDDRTLRILFAILVSISVAALWEFYEFGMDRLFGMDMQRDTIVTSLHSYDLGGTAGIIGSIESINSVTVNGQALEGYLDIGLIDTMGDMMIETVGAVAYAVAYALDKGRHPAFIALPAPCRHPVREAAHAQSE